MRRAVLASRLRIHTSLVHAGGESMRKVLWGTLAIAIAASLALVATAVGAGSARRAIAGCAVGALTLLTDATWTVGADNPAYPPWFGGDEKKPWKVSNPYSGK